MTAEPLIPTPDGEAHAYGCPACGWSTCPMTIVPTVYVGKSCPFCHGALIVADPPRPAHLREAELAKAANRRKENHAR